MGVLGRPGQAAGASAERPKQKTGTGLGPTAQRVVSGPTLVSAADAAQNALAAAEADLPLVMPEPPAPPAPAPREESVAFQLGDDEIEEVVTAPPRTTHGVRPLAQPMALTLPAELDEGDLEVPEIPEDEPTKVGTPSPTELERARREGLAMLREREREEAQARAAHARAAAPPPAPLPIPAPPPGMFAGTAAGRGFGSIDLDVPAAPAPAGHTTAPLQTVGQTTAPLQTVGQTTAPLQTVGQTTAPLQAVGLASQATGTTTQKLVTSRPPPAPLPMSAPPPPVLVDVTPLTLAVETVEGFCDAIIARNTTVPCSRTREFVTAADNQTSVRVRVSQGESKKFFENTLLGEIELSGLRPARRGDVRIAVSFALDASGMLVVSAKDVGTGRETSTQVHLVGLPDAQEVARMTARQVARGM
jgi:molecular chaperone DnaK